MIKASRNTFVLGGGVTGLAAGIASGLPVYERERFAGGICASYYLRSGSSERLPAAPADGNAWRFEHGGGHWIFGGHPDVLALLETMTPVERIARRSSVFFPDEQRYVGFPLQHNLAQLPSATAQRALEELLAERGHAAQTMAQWLDERFGPTLGELFFHPFHGAYTAGLWRSIAPQDGYKTPLDRGQVLRGAFGQAAPAGYNVDFLYPRDGLDALMRALAAQADLRLGHEIVRIDAPRRELRFADGTTLAFDRLLATLPLNRLMALAGLDVGEAPDPYTSVLVLNIGAVRGPRCPDDHWLYLPRTQAGFHRVGFYSNVAEHFLPASVRGRGSHVCLYVERSYPGGARPSADEQAACAAAVVEELQRWGFIEETQALDASWVDVAYTWHRPGNRWVERSIAALAEHGIRVAGRYARWHFQGITDSLRDGLLAGHALRFAAQAE
ncbi:MAG: FAD-dependent oxidoreductase [Burkholderiales bacterium]|nr:FAD-dependent oxidoreductase [Burkholderiales bacterium]